LEGHFANRDPIGRTAFDWIYSEFESLGPFEVLPMKTTIAFAQGVNLAFVTTKRSGAEISLVLPAGAVSDRFTGSVPYSRTKAIYRTRITNVTDLDDQMRAWIQEAYETGVRR
jgi:hypothetical protein